MRAHREAREEFPNCLLGKMKEQLQSSAPAAAGALLEVYEAMITIKMRLTLIHRRCFAAPALTRSFMPRQGWALARKRTPSPWFVRFLLVLFSFVRIFKPVPKYLVHAF